MEVYTDKELMYWRGKVDSQLENLAVKVDCNTEKLDKIEDKLDTLTKQFGNGSKFIEWTFIRDKFGVPILLAFITFLVLTILPSVIILVYLLPQITELLQ